MAASPVWIWAEDVLQLHAATGDGGGAGDRRHPLVVLALVGDGAGRLLVGGDDEVVAGAGHVGEAEDLDRGRGAGLLDLLALVVDEGTHAAPGRAGDERVADLERAPLDEQGGHRAPAHVEVGLEHGAHGPPVGVGGELLDVGDHEQLLEEVVDAQVLQGGDLDHDRVAAPGLGDQLALGQLAHDLLRVGALAVDLVDGHDDGDLGRLGVVEGLQGLGHDAVVGRDDQDDDVGGLGAPGPHGGERLVAGGVDEGDQATVLLDLVGADVLGDATGLAGDHVGVADLVEELGLAVVDVAHDGDHGRPVDRTLLVLVLLELLHAQALLELDLLLLAGVGQADLGPDVEGEHLDHLVAEGLGRGDHLALGHEEPDHVGRGAVQLGTDVLRGGAPLDDDLALGDRSVLRGVLRHVHRPELFAVATPPPLATRGPTTGGTTGTTGATATGTTAATGRRTAHGAAGARRARGAAGAAAAGTTAGAGGRGAATAEAGRGRDGPTREPAGRAGGRRDGLARRAAGHDVGRGARRRGRTARGRRRATGAGRAAGATLAGGGGRRLAAGSRGLGGRRGRRRAGRAAGPSGGDHLAGVGRGGRGRAGRGLGGTGGRGLGRARRRGGLGRARGGRARRGRRRWGRRRGGRLGGRGGVLGGSLLGGGRALLLGRRLLLAGLLRLLVADQAFALRLATDPVGLGLLDARGVGLDADAEVHAEIERLLVGEAELLRELVDADLSCQGRLPSPSGLSPCRCTDLPSSRTRVGAEKPSAS